jgi:group I intron endonuclease
MNKIGIYKLTNTINNKIYIGKSINLSHRLSSHKYARGPLVVSRAIKKYGWKNFRVDILESFDHIEKDDLLQREAKWIKELDATNPLIGYNILSFSSDCSGRKHTREELKKMRQPRSKQSKINITIGNQNKNNQPVKQLSIQTGEVIKIWDSVREACKHFRSNRLYSGLISMVCNHQTNSKGCPFRSAYGFKWEYVTT